jgi:hypothetical protein
MTIKLESVMEGLIGALTLAEYDQIDLLNECRYRERQTDDPELKEMRKTRADRVEERLNLTRAVLTAAKMSRKTLYAKAKS